MRRILIVVAVVVTAAALSTATASATGPVVEPVPPGDFVLRGICRFPVHWQDIVAKEVMITFPDGHIVIRGPLVTKLTNVRTGKHVVIDISGPVFIYPQKDGRTILILRGRSGLFLTAAESGLGHPLLWFVNGRTKIVIDKQGHLHLRSFPAHHIDMCARLAANDDDDDDGGNND